MCGLTGLFDCAGERTFDPALIQAMTDAVAHRGPDGEGVYNAPGIALGHRRLAFIDLAGGIQPMHTADGALTIVFNGEIYNFPDLMAELKAQGAQFQTRSDTEVLLHGWRHWGTGLFARLRGMFAFALWDVPQQTLVLARDRFGKKPMHYATLPDGQMVFGSEIKSLLKMPGLDRALDPTAVEDFFTYGYVPDPKTIYAAIRKLPAAHALIARRGQAPELMRYWNLLDNLHPSTTPAEPQKQMVDALRHAVKARLISDVEVGALLSGGVDSSAVVALMAGEQTAPVSTFSIGFEEKAYDESNYARAVSDRYRTSHHSRIVDPGDFSLLPRLPDIYDEPFGDISALPTFAVCKLARQTVKAALTGDGGDEILGGYRRYAFFAAQMRARAWMPDALRAPLFSFLANIYPHGARLPRFLRAKTTFRELSLSPADAYLRMVSALPVEIRAQILSPEFRKKLGGYDSGDIVRQHFNVDAPLDMLQRAQYADIMTYLPGDILTKVDRASMANSLELRSPFLDQELSDWAFSLPDGLKLERGAGGKAVLKKAMEAFLPHELLYRPKKGFTIPVSEWFRGPLKDDVRKLAHSARLKECGFFDTGAISAMAEAHIAGSRDFSKPLWLLWVFGSFLEHAAQAE
ncbi:MAG TPA: XrtA/PEP-CTERM system amidotransferase [Rhizomicrobium sp.]